MNDMLTATPGLRARRPQRKFRESGDDKIRVHLNPHETREELVWCEAEGMLIDVSADAPVMARSLPLPAHHP